MLSVLSYFYPYTIYSFLVFNLSSMAYAQSGPNRERPAREHQVNQSSGLNPTNLVPANVNLPYKNEINIKVIADKRVIWGNGIPDHKTGAFPNEGNPHEVEPQRFRYEIPAKPKLADQSTPLSFNNFGVGINGIPFDPGAAEWYLGKRDSQWRYEALAGAIPLGIDENHAHVQPNGAYHYHGLPQSWLNKLGFSKQKHSPLAGWAADGFPIYALSGYVDSVNAKSGIKELRSSYRLKKGERPTGNSQPGGTYDGTFVNDYEFISGAGDLDECNGRYGKTPEFTGGTYAYFLTTDWPVIPRCFKGYVDASFKKRSGKRKGRMDHKMKSRRHRHPHPQPPPHRPHPRHRR